MSALLTVSVAVGLDRLFETISGEETAGDAVLEVAVAGGAGSAAKGGHEAFVLVVVVVVTC